MPTKTQQTMAAYIKANLTELGTLADRHASDASDKFEGALLESAFVGSASTGWFCRLAEKFSQAIREHASDNGVEITDGM